MLKILGYLSLSINSIADRPTGLLYAVPLPIFHWNIRADSSVGTECDNQICIALEVLASLSWCNHCISSSYCFPNDPMRHLETITKTWQ